LRYAAGNPNTLWLMRSDCVAGNALTSDNMNCRLATVCFSTPEIDGRQMFLARPKIDMNALYWIGSR
jgi:hypothetical protein